MPISPTWLTSSSAATFSRFARWALGRAPTISENADLTSVPRTLPKVIGTRIIASTQKADGTWIVGGQVLEVCGVDGHNEPFYSELLVFYDGDRLISTNPSLLVGPARVYVRYDDQPSPAQPAAEAL